MFLVDPNIDSIGAVDAIDGRLGDWNPLGCRSVERADGLKSPGNNVSD